MKYLALTLIVLCVAVLMGAATASGPAPKLMCPVCKDAIKDGDYTCGLRIRGKIIPVCFKHAHDWVHLLRTKEFKEHMAKK